MKSKLLLSFILVTLFFSCATQEQRGIAQLRKFTISLQQESPNYTEMDWSNSINEYEQITQSLANGRFTDEERREIGRLKGQCTAVYSQYALQIFESELRGAASELEGALEGFYDAVQYTLDEY